MGFRLGSYRPKEVIQKLQRAGFVIDTQSGSHVVLLGPAGQRVLVAVHAKELKRGTLMAIVKQTGMTPEVFQKL